MPNPAIGKRAFLPRHMLSGSLLAQAQRELVFMEQSSDIVSVVRGRAPRDAVSVNECREVATGWSVPRAWALSRFPAHIFNDNSVRRRAVIGSKRTIKPRDIKQKEFFNALECSARKKGAQDILANADTGVGKTVAGLYLGQALATPTLIIVDSNKIANGWRKNIRKFFGSKWAENNTGLVQQNTCDYYGMFYTLTLAQSLASRKYPASFYHYFGLVIFDEVQVFGGPTFGDILGAFSARVRVGLTAENRRGQFGNRIKAHLGDTKITSTQKALEPLAWLLTYRIPAPFTCRSDGQLLTNLAQEEERNNKVAELIVNRGYNRGRKVLILSDRIAQLQYLITLCKDLGVPSKEVGLHVGKFPTDRFVIYYTYANSNKRNRLTTAGNETAAKIILEKVIEENYIGIDLPAPLLKYLGNGGSVLWETVRDEHTPTAEELERITTKCSLVFATCRIFAKGVDVPSLDMGVEALPLGNVKQPLGRILRSLPGKSTPEWYAIHDVVTPTSVYDRSNAIVLSAFFKRKTAMRMRALHAAHARIKVQ